MNALTIFLKYARYRYIAYRLFLRIKMGKTKRDDYLTKIRSSPIDFLPERSYVLDCGAKAIPRRGTRDFAMLFVTREQDIGSNLTMKENVTFVDVGANVGAYTLMIANDYKAKGVKVIAIEAHPENFKALYRNIRCNDLTNVNIINKAVSDHKGIVNLYERSHDGRRAGSDVYSLFDTFMHPSITFLPNGRTLQIDVTHWIIS
jgi:16S rRNA C967 or C1407 C5-methylase (RsmB/RsmF family)